MLGGLLYSGDNDGGIKPLGADSLHAHFPYRKPLKCGAILNAHSIA